MAVGIVIGGAFGKIVTSFVNDILMPPIGVMMGGVDFADLAITLKAATAEAEAVTINYGAFINTALDFVIIAFAIFIVIKQMNKLKKEEPVEEEPEEDPKPTQEDLLSEIRDLLKK
jgi:large conductance mechanosensitive channel